MKTMAEVIRETQQVEVTGEYDACAIWATPEEVSDVLAAEGFGRVATECDTCSGFGIYGDGPFSAGRECHECAGRGGKAIVEPQDSDCASCYTGTDCGMCTTIAPPGETNTTAGPWLTSSKGGWKVPEGAIMSRQEAASRAMLWAETMGRSSLDQMAAEGIAAADLVLFSDAVIERAVKRGLEAHDLEMLEAQTGDITEAVEDAIRAAVSALRDGR